MHRPALGDSALNKTLCVSAVFVAHMFVGRSAAAQQDPGAAQPERPTIATHAYTVARGYAETEIGIQATALDDSGALLAVPLLLKVGLGRGVQLDIDVPMAATVGSTNATGAGLADWALGVKARVAHAAPLLADLSFQSTLKFPTGSTSANRGTGTTDVSLLLISSRRLGSVSLDLNAGWTVRSGDGTVAPRRATLWTVSTGFPVHDGLGWDAEVFGYPGTHGPAGQRAAIGLLTGPAFTVRPSLVLDAGVIINLRALGANSAYAGFTRNFGRIF
jgi:hypothetical protein